MRQRDRKKKLKPRITQIGITKQPLWAAFFGLRERATERYKEELEAITCKLQMRGGN